MYLIEEYINENELCRKIINKADHMDIDYVIQDKILGFGKYHGFYMFYIVLKNKQIVFVIRESYNVEAKKIELSLKEENEEQIFALIDHIHTKYLNFIKNHSNEKIIENDYIAVSIRELNEAFENFKRGNNEDGKIQYSILSTRLTNVFKLRKIRTYKELMNYSPDEIRHWKQCGRKTINEIISLLNNPVFDTENHEEPTEHYNFLKLDDIESLITDQKNYFYRVDDSDIGSMAETAKLIFESFDLYLSLILEDEYGEIYKKRHYSDSVTLESIGKEFSLSRERIRQIVNKANRQIFNYKNKYKHIDLVKKIEQNISLYHNEKYTAFIFYGLLMNYSERYVQILLNWVYNNASAAKIILSLVNKYFENIKINSDKSLENIAYFPIRNDRIDKFDFNSLKTENYEFEYQMYYEAEKKIELLDDVNEIMRNPNISFSGLKPTFCVKNKYNHTILVYICNKLNFAVYYNKIKFLSLHNFCESYGFGYVIMDQRMTTIFDLKKRKIDVRFEEELDNYFNVNDILKWDKLKKIKNKYDCTNDDIIAYILQRNLYFSLQPYFIKKSKNS